MISSEPKGSIHSHHSEPPVENADQDLQWCTAHRQEVLDQEEPPGQRGIGENGNDKGQSRQAQTDDGQVLKMPAICLVPGMVISIDSTRVNPKLFRENVRVVRVLVHAILWR